ncbi:ABC transporter permease [Tardiphaga sp. 866_E4_N2_1]|jgi:NitT/TauT family transport system permease protein|uniref:ABC transporter permease n=1 Tax=unclassified Tardiphaga TaxID=2631404 RepID=UPI003F24DF55
MNERLNNWLSPLLTLVAFLGAWELITATAMVPSYLIPKPGAVATAAWILFSTGTIMPHLTATALEMVLGFVLGSAVALIFACVVAESRTVERCVYPFVVALQSMPKVALAPLLIVWFGFGLASKVVLVALICFFPVFVNALTGMQAARGDLVDLYRAFSAPRWKIFLDVKLPSAAGAIFAGLQVGLVLALLGAVVGEFVAAQQGLGSLIQASSLNFDVPTMFVCILTLAFMGSLASLVVRIAHRRVVFWEGAGKSASITKRRAS